jgi:hypothetical protein
MEFLSLVIPLPTSSITVIFGKLDSRAASTKILAFHRTPKLITASKQPVNGPSLMSIECCPISHVFFLYDVFNLLINALPFQYLSPRVNKKRN